MGENAPVNLSREVRFSINHWIAWVKAVPGRVVRFLRATSASRPANEPIGNRLIIETMSACNAKCGYCPMQSQKKIALNYMRLEQFERLIRESADYIRRTYTGVEPYYRGEALLHKQFWEICAVLHEYGIRNWGINSNLSIKNLAVEKFLEFKVPLLVNMGGTTREVHEKVMKGSDFDLVVGNIKELLATGFDFQVKINPTKRNIHQIHELPALLESWGRRREQVVTYTTCYPIPATASQAEKEAFFEDIVSPEVDPYLRFTYDLSKPGFDIRAKKPGCNFLIDTIYFDGQMTMCCHDQLQMVNIGNVFHESLESIRASDRYRQAIEKAKGMQHAMCPECN